MGSLMGSGQGSPMATQADRAKGIQVQSSNWGKGLPIVYGRARVSGNLIWYGDFQAVKHSQQVGKGGGGNTSSSYTYSSSFMLALCEGPVTKLGTIWKGSGTLSLSSLNGTFKAGAAGQTPWSHFSGGDALNYPYVAWVACLNIKLGSSPNVPNLNFEVYGLLPFNAGTIDDAEPSAIVNDLMTSQTHGIDFNYLGDLTQFRDYCVANGIFISPVIDQETSMLQLLKQLLVITNSTSLWDGGKLTLLPYSDQAITGNGVTYTPNFNSVADLGPDDFVKPLRIERKPLSSLYNCIRVEYVDRSNNYVTSVAEAKDQADIDRRGVRSLETIQAHAIKDGALANAVANRILQRNLYIRNQFRTTLDMRHFGKLPGDVVTLTDPLLNLNKLPVLLIEVNESGNNQIDIVAEEFAEGVSESAGYPTEPGAGFTPNTEAAPDTTATPVIFRAPQFLVESPEIWMGVSGSGNDWGGANVWASFDGASYTQIGTVFPGCRYGTVTAALAAGTDPDTTNGFSVQLDGQGGELNGGTQTDADENQTLMLVDQELISYETTTLNPDGTYTLGGNGAAGSGYLRRGQYKTTIAQHAVGAPWLRVDDYIFRWQVDPSMVGKTIYLKFTAFNLYGGGEEELANVNEYTYVVGQAEEIPDTPAEPTNLVVTPAVNGNKLSWDDPNPAAVRLDQVEYSTDGNTWSYLGQTKGEAIDHNFNGNASYWYRVKSLGQNYLWGPYLATTGATQGGSVDHAWDGLNFAIPRAAYLKDGRPFNLIGAYNSSTVYHQGDEVTFSGNYYKYINATAASGIAPTNAGSWLLIGPATADDLKNGGTYGLPLIARLNAGRPWIDFAEGIHANKNTDNIAETATNLHLKNALQVQMAQRSESANLLRNAQIESTDFWLGQGNAALSAYPAGTILMTLKPPASGNSYPTVTQSDERGNVRLFPVKPGDVIYAYSKIKSGQAVLGYNFIELYDINGANGTSHIFTSSTLSSSYQEFFGVYVVPTTINGGAVPSFMHYSPCQVTLPSTAANPTHVYMTEPLLLKNHQTLTQSGGAQLGSGLNLFGLNSAGYATAYWTGITFTPGPGSMAVSAGTLHVGQETKSYNSSSISGQAYSTPYSYFYQDKGYAGGSQTLQATTSKQSLSGNDGNLYIGDATTQSSGGTGGGGTIGSCLALDMFLRPNVPAIMACVGQKFDAYDKFTALGQLTLLNAWVETGAAVRITTSNGSVLDCGEDTPFDLKDGTSKLAKDMLGETVITDGGEDTVASVTNIGVVPLMYVSGGGVTIMAGADPTKRIGSHNAMKP